MARYTITPWRHSSDLFKVRQQLYRLSSDSTSNSEDLRRHAVDRILAWKLRGNLPHAVESTALLVDAILHHQNSNHSNTSSFSIRAVYTAAFTRFVTGFCDIGRSKERSLEPSSMLEIARQIDMPAEFVALRHEATHEEMPGLRRLVEATERGLEWLWRVYWSRLEEPGEVKSALPEVKVEVAELLKNFRRARRDALRSNAQNSAAQVEERTSTCNTLPEMAKRSHRGVVAEVLIESRLLFPSSRELNSSLEGAYLIWDSLLNVLSNRIHNFNHTLVLSLQEHLSAPSTFEPTSDADKEALALWMLHVLESSEDEDGVLAAEVMKWCCLHPGYWTQRVGSEVLQTGDQGLKVDWEDLFKASLIQSAASAKMNHVEESNVVSREGDPTEGVDLVGSGGAMAELYEGRGSAGCWRRAILPPTTPIGVVR